MRTLPLLILPLLTTHSVAETKGALRTHLSTGYDSNAAREFVSPDGSSARASPLLAGMLAAEGLWRHETLAAFGTYDLGGRIFYPESAVSTYLQAANLEGSWAAHRLWNVGILARGKDRRGADRDYTDLAARGVFELRPTEQVSVRTEIGAHRFLYWSDLDYAFYANEVFFSTRYRFNKAHSVMAFGEWGPRNYDANARPRPDIEWPTERARVDQAFSAGVSYQFRGPFTAMLQYAFSQVESNSFGETTLRHRVTANAGVRLPFKWYLMGVASLQWTFLPDGIFISPIFDIREDEENHNSVSIKLARPLTSRLDFELRYAIYQSQLPQNNLSYWRHLSLVGLSFQL